MSNIILIHGSWHRGLHYSPLATELSQLGHCVLAPDLPGHEERVNVAGLKDITLDSYCKALCSWVDAQPEPCILIAHSLGGLIATQALEYCAEKVKQVIYISAFVPQPGESVAFLLRNNQGSILPKVSVPSYDGVSSILAPDKLDLFYNGLDPSVITQAAPYLVAEPNNPLKERLVLTHPAAFTVPRDYIVCTNDKIIMPSLQYDMSHKDKGIRHQVALECGHFPFHEQKSYLTKEITRLINE